VPQASREALSYDLEKFITYRVTMSVVDGLESI
jgi:hypothetical protein